MLKFSRGKSSVNIEKYEENLRQNGRILCDKEKMVRLYNYECVHRDSLEIYARDIVLRKSGGNLASLSRDSIYLYLTRYEGCPDRFFRTNKSTGFSLDMKRVLTPLLMNGYAEEFLNVYTEYKSVKSKCSNISSIIAACNDPFLVKQDGTELYQLLYSVNQQTNLRYNYKNFDIISQIPKEYTNAITVEDDYLLAWGDFAQSDLRIAYNLLLRNKDNYEIMYNTEDKYEGIARLIAKANGEDFDYETFKANRSLYKVYVLETIYGTRGSSIQSTRNFIQSLSKYLDGCEKYNEYVRRIDNTIAMNLPVVTKGYFGFEQAAPSNLYRPVDIRNFALNSPIQTGTSEIMILTVNSIIDRFRQLGYGPEDVSVYMVRHDEPVFRISKRALKDAWIFKNASEIYVDDWIPLKLDFKYGYYYGEEDEELSKAVDYSIALNEHKIETVEADSYGMSKEYYPIADVGNVYWHLAKVGKKTVLAVYDPVLQAANIALINSTDQKKVEATSVAIVRDLAQLYKKNGFNGVIAHSNFVSGALYNDGILVKFINGSGAKLYQAQLFAEVMANRIEKVYPDRSAEMRQYNLRMLADVLGGGRS